MWNFLKTFDIIVLQETWLEKEYESSFIASLDNQFIFKTKPAVRSNKKGRAKGGQLVGIRKDLGDNIIFTEWEYGLILEGDCLTLENKKFDVITVYNNEGLSKVANKMSVILEDRLSKGNGLVILGDWNARTACESGIIDCDSDDISRNYSSHRNSEDAILNTEGKKLINLCSEYGLRILNGSIAGDKEGKLTYVGEVGSSVLDYIIIKEDEEESPIKSMKIVPRLESDHLPITFEVKVKSTGKVTDKKK